MLCWLLPATSAYALTFDLGGSVSQASLALRAVNNNARLAEMVDRASLWPSVSLKTRERYFGDTHFGYSAEMFAWYMRMNRQKVNGQELNLGTSAKGYFAYLTPTVYYRFGDKYSMESDGWMTTLGIGLGVGYLNVKGTMLTTEITPQRLQAIDGVGFGFSSGLFAEVMKKRWFVRLTNYGPILRKGSLKLDLRYNSITLGRRFEF
ncbi:MAG: hypothetical protein R8L58_01185 [Mariprofundaceae bacterium]